MGCRVRNGRKSTDSFCDDVDSVGSLTTHFFIFPFTSLAGPKFTPEAEEAVGASGPATLVVDESCLFGPPSTALGGPPKLTLCERRLWRLGRDNNGGAKGILFGRKTPLNCMVLTPGVAGSGIFAGARAILGRERCMDGALGGNWDVAAVCGMAPIASGSAAGWNVAMGVCAMKSGCPSRVTG